MRRIRCLIAAWRGRACLRTSAGEPRRVAATSTATKGCKPQTPANLGLHPDGGGVLRSRLPHGSSGRKDPFSFVLRRSLESRHPILAHLRAHASTCEYVRVDEGISRAQTCAFVRSSRIKTPRQCHSMSTANRPRPSTRECDMRAKSTWRKHASHTEATGHALAGQRENS